MSDFPENNQPPNDDAVDNNLPPEDLPEAHQDEANLAEPVTEDTVSDEQMDDRLERLGGEPAPDITPEEFARLRQSGQIHIDPRGRVRSHRRDNRDPGVSLRKRRAWY